MAAELGLSHLSWPSHPPAQWGRLKSLWKSRELLELLKCCYMLLHVATSFSSRHQTQARERYAFASILKFILRPFLSMPMQSNLFFNAKLYSSSSVNYQERRINNANYLKIRMCRIPRKFDSGDSTHSVSSEAAATNANSLRGSRFVRTKKVETLWWKMNPELISLPVPSECTCICRRPLRHHPRTEHRCPHCSAGHCLGIVFDKFCVDATTKPSLPKENM